MGKRISGAIIALSVFVFVMIGDVGSVVMAVDADDVFGADALSVAKQMLEVSECVVDVIEEGLMSRSVSAVFRGSKTPAFIRKLMLLLIRERITEDVVAVTGMDVEQIAQEIYVMACLYYDAVHIDGRSAEDAHRATAEEGVRYLLVEKMTLSDDEARCIISSLRYDRVAS